MTTSIPRSLAPFRPAASRVLLLPRLIASSTVATRVLVVVALAVAYGLLFRNLLTGMEHMGILDWDEARHGVSAYEMLQNGNFLVNTYRGAPDYWNLKPPISFWAIAASFKLFGYTALALRLPSLVATVLVTVIVTVFAYRRMGRVAAVVATLFLASSSQLLNSHSGRTGDPDALFILFMTGSALCTILAAKRPALLIASTTFFSLAFLTKSFHAALALLFIPLMIAVMRKHQRPSLRIVLLSLLGFVPVVAWAVARMQFDGTQFLSQMVNYDLLSRGSTVIEGHTGPPESYVQQLRAAAGPWLLLAFGAGLALIAGKRWSLLRAEAWSDRGRDLIGAALWCLLVIGAFSAASSKLPWYTTPAVPLLALLVGGLVGYAARQQTGAVRAALFAGLAVALTLTQLDLRDIRNAEIGVPMQVLLFGLHRSPAYSGDDIYLDPAANYSDANSAWSQSMTLAAELGGDLVPRDGGLPAIQQTAGPTLVFVQRGSPTEAALAGSGQVREVSSDSASRIVLWTRTAKP